MTRKLIRSQQENPAIHGGDEQRLLSINHNIPRFLNRGSRRLIFINLGIALFLCIAVAVSFAEENADYTAIVYDVAGVVSVRRNAEKQTATQLKIGDMLYPGDIVRTEKNASVTVDYFVTGRLEEWPPESDFCVGTNGTQNLPSGVAVSVKELQLPENISPGHIGTYVDRDVQVDEPDLEEALPGETKK